MVTNRCLRRSAWSGCTLFVAASISAAFASNSALAQTADLAIASPPPSAPATSSAPTLRDAEYASLARDVAAMEREFGIVKRVVKLVTPAVVHIESQPLPRYKGLLHVEEAGSGVIVQFGAGHFVLTNRHVIRHSSPERIEIHLADGRVFHPTRIWSDSETDVAAMSISASGLVPARLGNSDSLEIGDFVLAVGSPFGLSQSVTRGIVSAKGRHNLDLGDEDLRWQNFIQTDAAINPGNSGGPLVNLRGEIVGLNTAIASASGGNEGIGFSIPINIVSRIARALVSGEEPPRGILGVDLDETFNARRAKQLGLPQLVGTRVIAVTPNSPALVADIQVDDVIVQFNGVTIADDTHLRGLVKLSEVGMQAELVIFRGGKAIRKTVQIASAHDFVK
jgi:serine protease Do